jgi:serine/threonine protein phosphatase PrpC
MGYQSWGDTILDNPGDEHPDERSLGLTFSRYCLVGASVRGKMHRKNKVSREDAFAVYRKDQWLAIAVSDGVGSSKYSRLGATYAVNKMCQNLLSQLEKPTGIGSSMVPRFIRDVEPRQEQLEMVMREGLRLTASGLKEHASGIAKSLQCQGNAANVEFGAPVVAIANQECGNAEGPKQEGEDTGLCKQRSDSAPEKATVVFDDFHCTLLATMFNLKSGTVALAQVGDGLILGLAQDRSATPLVEPRMPEQMGQTYVITQDNWERYCAVRAIPKESAKAYLTIYLMTDGVADDCQYGPPEDILQRWANEMDIELRKYDVETTRERLARYLNDYEAKGSYDDRTLVAIYRRGQK